MELYNNLAAPLTRWLVSIGALREPFRLLDIGAALGVSPRWLALGEMLAVTGFEPIHEAIAPLIAAKKPHDRYFAMALGNEDGEREFFVPAEKTAASVYAHSQTRYAVNESTYASSSRRTVPIRRLDTLFAAGEIGPVDFIKLDCEGFEPEVLKGAKQYLAACDLVGADLETNFNVSPVILRTHFWESYEPFLARRLLVHDIQFNRVPHASFASQLTGLRSRLTDPGLHRPATVNVLLARSLVSERQQPASYAGAGPVGEETIDLILKQIIVFELYGLLDCAYDLLVSSADVLGRRLDIRKAERLLVPSVNVGHAAGNLVRRLKRKARSLLS